MVRLIEVQIKEFFFRKGSTTLKLIFIITDQEFSTSVYQAQIIKSKRFLLTLSLNLLSKI